MFLSSTLIGPMVVGALLNLDRQVCGPFMVSRPIMTGFVIGLMIGEISYGIWLGLAVELLWLAILPLGGQVTPNAGLAVSAALIAWIGSSFAPAVGAFQTHAGLALSFATVPFWAWAFTLIDKICRRFAGAQVSAARQALAAGLEPDFFRRNISGVWVTFACSLVAILAAVSVNTAILYLVVDLAPDILTFLFAFIPFLGLLGMAVFLESRTFTFYLWGLLASLLALSAV